ncbi:MAG: type I-C CRISPR-associated protein Cas8c/Csd1 [Gemmatimonadota bacterium]|nr:type I-C CRISPR-associated protein Cas8c/Csd1 [Gemmatimonadota bacterium]
MLLHALNQLYDRLADDADYAVVRPGFSLQKINFEIVLRPDGQLVTIQDARSVVDRRARPRQRRVLGSTKPPGSGLNPCFLWDNAQYMLGFKIDDLNPERTAEAFAAFRDRHLSVEEAVSSEVFSAVCRFLETWNPESAGDFEDFVEAATTGYGLFRIQGIDGFVHDDENIQTWWMSRASPRWWEAKDGGGDDPQGQCLVSGEVGFLARTHEKVKGVRGAQPSGGALVGFNDPAYESYGKSQSYNAPVSETVAFRYVTALNALLDGPQRDRHRVFVGETTVVFWTGRPNPAEDIFLRFAAEGSAIADADTTQDEGQRQRVELFLRALRQGREAYGALDPDPDGAEYFLLGLSPNAGRVSVRFFMRGRLGALLDNLRRHHRDIRIDPKPPSEKWRGDPEFPGVRALLDQAARERKDIPPTLEAPLMRAIVTGEPYPTALVGAVLRRIRADRRVDYLRSCVIKGYLVRNHNMEVSMALDPEKPDPAYRLGRLFAALEKTQKDGLPGLNTTIRDSFYSAASATPGTVFPRLLRTYQHHLGKLEGGLRVTRERLVQEILAPLERFPSHLTLPDQGLFALGYYHQTRDFYTKRSEPSDHQPVQE